MKSKAQSRVGNKFCGTVHGQYSENWKFLEYLGHGKYLVAIDKGHEKTNFTVAHFSGIK